MSCIWTAKAWAAVLAPPLHLRSTQPCLWPHWLSATSECQGCILPICTKGQQFAISLFKGRGKKMCFFTPTRQLRSPSCSWCDSPIPLTSDWVAATGSISQQHLCWVQTWQFQHSRSLPFPAQPHLSSLSMQKYSPISNTLLFPGGRHKQVSHLRLLPFPWAALWRSSPPSKSRQNLVCQSQDLLLLLHKS